MTTDYTQERILITIKITVSVAKQEYEWLLIELNRKRGSNTWDNVRAAARTESRVTVDGGQSGWVKVTTNTQFRLAKLPKSLLQFELANGFKAKEIAKISDIALAATKLLQGIPSSDLPSGFTPVQLHNVFNFGTIQPKPLLPTNQA